MKYIGAHVSAAGGVHHAPLRAGDLQANAFALFTKNQKRWTAKPLDPADIEAFKKNLSDTGIEARHILPHDSYLINLANPDGEKRKKSLHAFIDEGKRAAALGIPGLNFHPGAHLGGMSEAEALRLIAEGIDCACRAVEEIRFVVETTAGQGTSLGYRFEHLRDIIGASDYPERIGVCIDTCHIFAAGYDIRGTEEYAESMDAFERIIGFDKLYGVHCNDAKSEFASRVDRHESIGKGNIGFEPFRRLMRDPRFNDIPIILETPNPDLWAEEIGKLRGAENGV